MARKLSVKQQSLLKQAWKKGARDIEDISNADAIMDLNDYETFYQDANRFLGDLREGKETSEVKVRVVGSDIPKEFPIDSEFSLDQVEKLIKTASSKITGEGEDKVRFQNASDSENKRGRGFTIRVSKDEDESIDNFKRESDYFVKNLTESKETKTPFQIAKTELEDAFGKAVPSLAKEYGNAYVYKVAKGFIVVLHDNERVELIDQTEGYDETAFENDVEDIESFIKKVEKKTKGLSESKETAFRDSLERYL